jgi:hypothetical protein
MVEYADTLRVVSLGIIYSYSESRKEKIRK